MILHCFLQSTEHVEVIDPDVPPRANDIIHLIFTGESRDSISNGSESIELIKISPSFTHQLFDEEKMVELVVGKCENHHISIYVSCSDLSHRVVFSNAFNKSQIDSISAKLQAVLPENTTIVQSCESRSENGTSASSSNFVLTQDNVPGKMLTSFSHLGRKFQVRLAKYSDVTSRSCLSRLEKIAMWFIETADSVDYSDDRWEVLFLIEELPTSHFEIVGYATLFSFRNPFAGSKLRICQFLIFPFLQRMGLGALLLESINLLAFQRSDVVEITVEDPAEGFQLLRDFVDFQWMLFSWLSTLPQYSERFVAFHGMGASSSVKPYLNVHHDTESYEKDDLSSSSAATKRRRTDENPEEWFEFPSIFLEVAAAYQKLSSFSKSEEDVLEGTVPGNIEVDGSADHHLEVAHKDSSIPTDVTVLHSSESTKPNEISAEVFSRLKLTSWQLHFITESWEVLSLGTEKLLSDDDPWKAFRLKVKRRLWYQYPDLRQQCSKDTRIKELEHLFQKEVQRFQSVEKVWKVWKALLPSWEKET